MGGRTSTIRRVNWFRAIGTRRQAVQFRDRSHSIAVPVSGALQSQLKLLRQIAQTRGYSLFFRLKQQFGQSLVKLGVQRSASFVFGHVVLPSVCNLKYVYCADLAIAGNPVSQGLLQEYRR